MKFTPLDIKKDAPANYLLPAGDYEVEVVDAEEGVSKAGNAQIKLKLRIIADGMSVTTFDYLGATSKKLRNFCLSMGLQEKYEHGEITDLDCANKRGHASVKVERSEEYGDKNKVAFYIDKPEPKKPAEDFTNDDVPF